MAQQPLPYSAIAVLDNFGLSSEPPENGKKGLVDFKNE